MKIKEWWGAKVTIDPQMETKKQKINEIDQYIKGLTQSFSNLSALFQCKKLLILKKCMATSTELVQSHKNCMRRKQTPIRE